MSKKIILILVAAIAALVGGIACYFIFRPIDIASIVPANSVAVAKIDFTKAGGNATATASGNAITKLLNVDSPEECGLDFESPAYLFESGDGMFGFVVGVSDDDKVEDWIGNQAEKGVCTPLAEKKDVMFTSFHNTLLAGFNSEALLIMGPVVAASEGEQQLKIAKYLKGDEDNSIKTSDLYAKLSTMGDGLISLVAQTSALPEKIVAPFTLGAPASASPSDIYLAASIDVVDGKYLSVEGETFAFDEEIDKSLKEASKAYNEVKGTYLPTISSSDAFAISCNIAGKEYMKLLRSNPMLRTILMGLNTTIDISKMLDGVDGDILIKGTFDSKANITPTLLADASNGDWLEDVGYWKKSCPIGTSIVNGSTPKTFSFGSPDYHIDFGLTNGDKTLFFATHGYGQDILAPASNALPEEITQKMKSTKLCALVNIKAVLSAYGGPMATIVATPILGNINTIVIGVK